MNNELSFDTWQDACTVADVLIRNEYVVMLSREEDLYILNYIDTCECNEANRNGVVFMAKEDFEDFIFKNNEGDTEDDII